MPFTHVGDVIRSACRNWENEKNVAETNTGCTVRLRKVSSIESRNGKSINIELHIFVHSKLGKRLTLTGT